MIPLVSIESKVNSGCLAIDYSTNTLIIWGKDNILNCQTGCVFDIENNKQILSLRDITNNPTYKYIPYFMSKDELIVLNSEKGSFDFYDLTSGQHIKNVNLPGMYTNINIF